MKAFHNHKFVAFGILLLVKPGCIAGIPELYLLDTLLDLLRLVLLGYIIMGLAVKSKLQSDRVFKTMLLIFAFEIWRVVSTWLSSGGFTNWGIVMNGLGISLFAYMSITTDYGAFLKGSSRVLGTYVILNSLSVIIFPDGMYASAEYTENYFLSYRTSWMPVYLFALTVTLLWADHDKCKATRRWAYLVTISAFTSIIMVWTATSLLCFSISGIFLLVWTYGKKAKPMRIETLMIWEAVLFVVSVVFRMQQAFEFILVSLLNRDTTLTYRTRIWDNAMAAIMENFPTGVGDLSPAKMEAYLGYGVTHAHCHYLTVQMSLGIVGTGLFLYLIWYSTHRTARLGNCASRRIIIAAFIVFLTACQAESFFIIGYYLYPLYLIAAAISDHMHDPIEQPDRRCISS